jgi:glycerol uptake facilitator-like aquaporin
MLSRLNIAALAAEFLGTVVLVMVALVLTQTTAVSYFIGTSVAIGLLVVYMAFGSISGGHFNPAITFAMWTARRITAIRGISYIAVQMLAGLGAWQLFQYMTERSLPAKTTTYTTHIWLAELIGTFVLAMGLMAAISRGYDALQSAITYSAAFFVGIMIAATASAAYLNPAIALGVRSWSTAYVLGPIVGGVLGVNVYNWLVNPMSSKINWRRYSVK